QLERGALGVGRDGDADGVVDLGERVREDGIEHDALDLDDLADVLRAVRAVRVRARHVAPEWVEIGRDAGRRGALAAPRVYRSAGAPGRASGGLSGAPPTVPRPPAWRRGRGLRSTG